MESFHDREVNCGLKNLYILERSIKSSLKIFATLNCTNDEIAKLEAQSNVMGIENQDTRIKPLYIYVHTPYTQCLKNIQHRKKPTDHYITLDYLNMLERKHIDVFLDKKDTVVVINNETIDKLVERVCKVIDGTFTFYNNE